MKWLGRLDQTPDRASLNHPHVCTLHDVGRHDDIDYIVMELVEGETLARRLDERGAIEAVPVG